MPLYEYVCEADGTVLELRRSMAEADAPVTDPEGQGRVFKRRLSTFQAKASTASASMPLPQGGCCPCGKPQSACGLN